MSFNISLGLMVPSALRELANRLTCALGHDSLPGNTFSVGLSADGFEPASHWACHSWVQQSFVETLTGAGQGQLPQIDWAEFGLTVPEVWAVFAGIKNSAPSSTPLDFDEWIKTLGLKRVISEDSI